MTCGLDFDMDSAGLGFYDTWVARDVNGEFFRKRPLDGFTVDAPTNERLRRRLPFQVSCCWNGAVVLNAEPFCHDESDPVRFRRTPSTLLAKEDPSDNNNNSGELLYGSCSGSEINSLCMDFYRRDYRRAVIVPRVKLAYDWPTYQALQQYKDNDKDNDRDHDDDRDYDEQEDSLIEFQPAPKAMRCYPMENPGLRSPDGIIGWERV